VQAVRFGCVSALAGTIACLSLFAQELVLRSSADQIMVAAPKLHFLTGKPLERLRDGNAVAFDFHLAVLAESKQSILRRSFDRFVISYDLWEEKFSISRMRTTRSSVSRLDANAAEAWCLDNIAVASSGLPTDKPVWVRLDIRAQENRGQQSLSADDDGISLTSLIEIFSRPVKQEPNQWRLEAGPTRLNDIQKSTGRTGI
jgi:hypothetical protein